MRTKHLFEQGVGEINEDFYVMRGNLCGVFDGATSLTPEKYGDGHTGGYLASHIAGETFKENDAPLHELAGRANAAIRGAMLTCGVDVADKANLWSASAAVVRVDADAFEYAQIGDCLIMEFHEDGGYEILSSAFNHDLETLELWKKVAETTVAPIREAMKDQIRKVRSRMNVAYGVLSGEEDALSFLNAGKRKLDGVSDIVIFTDGLFVPKKDPRDREDFHTFAELFRQGGLAAVREYIRNIEITDVACREFPRFKTHDDIAAISIAL